MDSIISVWKNPIEMDRQMRLKHRDGWNPEKKKKCLFLFFEHRIVRLFLRVHEQFEKGPATQLQDTGKKKGDLDLF